MSFDATGPEGRDFWTAFADCECSSHLVMVAENAVAATLPWREAILAAGGVLGRQIIHRTSGDCHIRVSVHGMRPSVVEAIVRQLIRVPGVYRVSVEHVVGRKRAGLLPNI